MADLEPPFSSHGFYLSVAYVQFAFVESAASIRVQFVFKRGFYKRLNGNR